MPTPGQPLVGEDVERLQVTLDPTAVMFTDLLLLEKLEAFPGLDSWVAKTVEALPPERRELHHQVIDGLYFALVPQREYTSFETYLLDLEQQDPGTWVDRLLTAYQEIECRPNAQVQDASHEELLTDVDLYLDYLRGRFGPDRIDGKVERQAHYWLNHPQQMQGEVIGHLRYMWRQHLLPAWERVRPMLAESVKSFEQVGLPDGSPREIARWVTGQELGKEWRPSYEIARRILFVPSAHVGPYVSVLAGDDIVWVVFGARTPDEADQGSPALSRSELLVRLNALADETRLHILSLFTQAEELCAQDVMNQLDLSQSTASRHLRQLSATGYLRERRVDSAKCYQLNRDQLQASVRALQRYFGL